MPEPANDRPLYYSAFVMNTPSHVIHGLWRDAGRPTTRSTR